MSNPEPLIKVQNLVKEFAIRRSLSPPLKLRAVNDVSFSIAPGETFGLVGESGCGKSTLGRTIMRLYDASSGTVSFSGANITALSGKALAPYQRRMQMIFQDPYSSLNPSMLVRDIIAEPLLLKSRLSKHECDEQIQDILVKVGMSPEDLRKYPHEFSGGQRQRISIARALIVQPEFVLCDEPISALDVSIQAQVVNLLEDLQQETGLTYLFVAHDLSMVRYISHRIGVMYMGELVEVSTARDIYQNPLHPYTRSLLAAIPIPNPRRARESPWKALEGEIPGSTEKIQGCAFASRCPEAAPACRQEHPVLRDTGDGHQVACLWV
ncbi:oligopeptide transport ATP-binding protein AppF [Treponema primitia ZAS-2]|uniref:Oligopeptide transport ATP-binding protein AppF n=1 Tax=Treponema primitia (strain ATCC BAA-887 / DSM 12427 / ZAS-2) TaxID=545694 RepID=F5YJ67_TREPZ|nr:oligopeptide/dipeptide ABC transporter ATP-binding protein [Treponema primitia]AEF86332.1 oligopeptide transport ATP-binding protein AppF [Treponema primitia ZAS-2]